MSARHHVTASPDYAAVQVRGGIAHEIKAGDVVVIPAGTGHWFTKIDDHIDYIRVRSIRTRSRH